MGGPGSIDAGMSTKEDTSTTAAAAAAEIDLDAPELFINRELSWMTFNDRVLQLAEDPAVPLLERLKFLAIYTSNLDEFFMVRVAGLQDQIEAGIDARGPDGLSPRRSSTASARSSSTTGAASARAWSTRSARRCRSTASGSWAS